MARELTERLAGDVAAGIVSARELIADGRRYLGIDVPPDSPPIVEILADDGAGAEEVSAWLSSCPRLAALVIELIHRARFLARDPRVGAGS